MQPPSRMGLYVSIEDTSGKKLLSGKTAIERLNRLLSEPSPIVIHPRIVTGRLDALEFQTRILKLQLPNGKPLNCGYGEDFEPVLVENRREWIQVRGEAVLNDDDTLKALNNISEIIEVDVLPIEIEGFEIDGQRLKAKAARSIDVQFDPSDGVYAGEGDFHLMVPVETREELESAVTEALAFLWREFAEANPQFLTADARELRQSLRSSFGVE